ncbi:Ala-tRNA(Pro) deacylase [Dethiosulfatibacter aminovorans DSM 17477]|uniref:Ala-tRNA(Pro) deacylase n=1 Tax=Dethiosulfatibacter aminovorans DSM 17477 TaxID=1121476 RepID=A0A1M6KU04_9FIRM|nr:prolyl-tRNA synthetase associated domain-containing protein [Dethiosulfatibacter aminovorans]SHJ62330.1 Ala-tRNA(Pro) deacylase [Dethiosulfatibacter aminovorans DSM 17477]
MENRENIVYEYLENLGIKYEKREHPPVYTCEGAAEFTGDMKGMHCKNLFFRNKKGKRHYLVIFDERKEVNIKNIGLKVGESNLSFASEQRMMKYLGVTPGAVSVFGLINDMENDVQVYIDKDVLESEYVNFHPNVNTATLNLAIDDFNRFLENCGNEINEIIL